MRNDYSGYCCITVWLWRCETHFVHFVSIILVCTKPHAWCLCVFSVPCRVLAFNWEHGEQIGYVCSVQKPMWIRLPFALCCRSVHVWAIEQHDLPWRCINTQKPYLFDSPRHTATCKPKHMLKMISNSIDPNRPYRPRTWTFNKRGSHLKYLTRITLGNPIKYHTHIYNTVFSAPRSGWLLRFDAFKHSGIQRWKKSTRETNQCLLSDFDYIKTSWRQYLA